MLLALYVLARPMPPAVDSLADGFRNPPAKYRPQTWWHWMNGNVTKAGITADLEAMKQVGLGGAQMFTVDQGIPAGPAGYDGSLWREMTHFAVTEADRLGLQLCIHNGAGWSSSGGPWIKPENAMQVVAWSERRVAGPTHFDEVLPAAKAPQVQNEVPFYRDIATYAYPTPAAGDVQNPLPGDFLAETGVVRGDSPIDLTPLTSCAPIPASGLVMLTDRLAPDGRLTWDVPAGNWTILRMGYVPTGVTNEPAPPEGRGLEVDKLSRAALDTHWAGMLAKVIADAGPLAGKSLNDVLIDSYEVGSQNWSPNFRSDFRRLRGYDPLPFLPALAGRVVNDKLQSERFLWDLRKTIADLYAANYYGYMAELCHRNGLLFSAEPYGNGGFDTMSSGSKPDIPMAEFWLGGGAMETTKMVASIGHTYGRPIVGAESFTGDDVRGRWLEEPYRMKATGDLAFCNGINRYIFHRWAMQPWLDKNPGMTMGPWGTHFERTQTWFTEAATWIKYVQRCQYLLQQGRYVADVCYYYGDDSPLDLPYGAGLRPKLPTGFSYDGCDEPTLQKMAVKNGRIVLPSGMSYRLLVLPDSKFMRPEVIRKIGDLLRTGATIYGSKPLMSPSLQGYPACDATVASIANEIWGADDLAAEGARHVGNGQIFWGWSLDKVFYQLQYLPDFGVSTRGPGAANVAFIHRRLGDADVYFVSNQSFKNIDLTCGFTIRGKEPEIWNPVTGDVAPAAAYLAGDGNVTLVPMHFGPADSFFVVFRHPEPRRHVSDIVVVDPNEKPMLMGVKVDSARYEAADGRGADVTAKVRGMVEEGQLEIPATNDAFGDPVVNVRKHLTIKYTLDGKPKEQTVEENESVDLSGGPVDEYRPPAYRFDRTPAGDVRAVAWRPLQFQVLDHGANRTADVRDKPLRISLDSNWQVTFPPKLGAPSSASFPSLISWPDSSEFGIKYFSGSATYAKSFDVPASFLGADRAVRLDLGKVKNFATVTVNGQTVAVLWKPPFCLDVKRYLHAGRNEVTVKVTNLWPNRIIGDEQLPPDVEWQDGHLARWPEWMVESKPRPNTGRVTFETWHFWDKNSPLLESGLLGPVTLESARPVVLP